MCEFHSTQISKSSRTSHEPLKKIAASHNLTEVCIETQDKLIRVSKYTRKVLSTKRTIMVVKSRFPSEDKPGSILYITRAHNASMEFELVGTLCESI